MCPRPNMYKRPVSRRSAGGIRPVSLSLTCSNAALIIRSVKVGLLGPLEVDGLVLEPRDRLALSVLAVRNNQVVTADQLAEALWPHSLPASWSKQVQICISRLRKSLGPEAIATLPQGYRLELSDEDLDTREFEQLITRGHTLMADGEADRAAVSYARALTLWRGNPFEELDGWSPGQIERTRLLELRLSTQEDWLDARLLAGDHIRVAVDAGALVAEEPLRERRWRSLALAQYRSGRQADALRSLEAARSTLLAELGVDPGPELVELEQAILRHDPSLAAPPPILTTSSTCPYKGLTAYDEDDVELFFGRSSEVGMALDRLRHTPLLVLAGPSGSGKSSLARAGLVPALKQRGELVGVFVPGRDPLRALSEAAFTASTLVVDQLEELFALEVSDPEIKEFCTRLARHAMKRGPVIIVVRSDFLGELAVSPDLSRLAEKGLQLVSPLAGDSLRQAIEEPAVQAGLRLEHGLVELLERDTEGEPGALPLLSHALAETWRRRDGNVLTVEGYRASGGIRGAVARSADRLYDSLPPEQRSVLRSLLLRMVSPSIDGPPVRCRVPRRNVLGDPDRDRVVALLVRSRLVTAEEDSYELAHEALARAWPRLRSWLDDDAEGQRIMRHLAARAEEWEALGRPESELYRGARLEAVLEWQASGSASLNDTERAFAQAALELAATERDQELQRAHRDARQNRRLRALLVMAAVLLVVAAAGGLLALRGRQAARLEALVGQSLALRSTNRAAAALMAVEAYRMSPDASSWSALLGTFTSAPGFVGYQHVPGAESLTGAFIPGTTNAVIALDTQHLRVLDLDTGVLDDPFGEPPADLGWGSRIAVSADGRFVAQFTGRNADLPCWSLESLQERDDAGCATLRVLEIGTGRLVGTVINPPVGLGELAINRDGSLVAITGGFDGDLVVYRAADSEIVGRLDGLPRPEGLSVWRNAGVGFGADGRIYLGSMAGPLRVIDPETVEVLETYGAPELSSNNLVVVAPDGTVFSAGTEALASFDPDGNLAWTVDLRDGQHPEPCPWFAANPARGLIYCGTFFGTIHVRSAETGALTGTVLDPQLGGVGTLAVSADGGELVAFGAEVPAVSRWHTNGSSRVARLVAEGHAVGDGYSTAGDSLHVMARDPSATIDFDFTEHSIWDPAADVELGRVPGEALGVGWFGVDSLTGYSPSDDRIVYFDASTLERIDGLHVPLDSNHLWPSADRTRAYIGFPGRELWTVDTASGERIEPTIPLTGEARSVSTTRDGKLVVVTQAGPDGITTTVNDGATGEQVGPTLTGPSFTAVSLDGTLVGANRGVLVEYDLETMEPVAVVGGARGEINSLQFSNDGKVLLATSNDQTVAVYDVASHRRIGDPIPAHAPLIFSAFLRSDGRELAVTVKDGVLIWDIDPEHLAMAACKLAGRNMTLQEWQGLMGGFGPYRTTCPEYPSGTD